MVAYSFQPFLGKYFNKFWKNAQRKHGNKRGLRIYKLPENNTIQFVWEMFARNGLLDNN